MKKIITLCLTLLILIGCSSSTKIELSETYNNTNYHFKYNQQIDISEYAAGSAFLALNIKNTDDYMIISEAINFTDFGDSLEQQEAAFLSTYNGDRNAQFKDTKIGGIPARSLSFKDSENKTYQRMVFILKDNNFYFIRYQTVSKSGQALFDAIIETIAFN